MKVAQLPQLPSFQPTCGRAQAQPAPSQATSEPTDQVEFSTPPQEQPASLVRVGHKRELRGAWVASVWNINFPSSASSDVATQKREISAMVDRLKESGFNSIFFQVRPEGDALYKSAYEPWSHYLTGTQGKDPGYDPLAFLVQEAHAKNIEVHAWLNPYRAASTQSTKQAAGHMAVEHPEHVHNYAKTKWMDPGAADVRERLVDVCRDLTKNYDLDGVHFDDYFYPYPDGTNDFPDQATWSQYQASGGKLSRADWRRENVNTAVREVASAVKSEKDHVRFGISPFGIPAPEKPAGVSGLNQYEALYADTQKWMDEGWVDYLAPQLYWPISQPKQPYKTLLDWWADHSKGGRHVFAGNNLADLGNSSKWTVDEYRNQLAITRAKHDQGAQGTIWWHVKPLMENRQDIVKAFRDEFYAEPALSPALPTAAGKSVEAPRATVQGKKVKLEHRDKAPLRAWTVYRREGESWKLDRIVPGDKSEVELPSGQWAIAAATRHGNESLGVVTQIA